MAKLKESLSIVKLLLETLKHKDPKCRIQLHARNRDNQTAFDLVALKRHESSECKEMYDFLKPFYKHTKPQKDTCII